MSEEFQRRHEAWHEALVKAYENLTPERRAELQAWESEHLDGFSVGTSDWPGWEPLIGKPPWRQDGREDPSQYFMTVTCHDCGAKIETEGTMKETEEKWKEFASEHQRLGHALIDRDIDPVYDGEDEED